MFALLFNSPLEKLLPDALLPAGLAATAAFVLAWMHPRKWKLLAVATALPTLLMATALLGLLWLEGRTDGSWVLVAAAALCVCLLSAWLAARCTPSSR